MHHLTAAMIDAAAPATNSLEIFHHLLKHSNLIFRRSSLSRFRELFGDVFLLLLSFFLGIIILTFMLDRVMSPEEEDDRH